MKLQLRNNFTFSKAFIFSKSISLNKQPQGGFESYCQPWQYLIWALAATVANSSSIFEAYTSASTPFIETDDNNTTTWSTMGGQFTTTKNGMFLWPFHHQISISRIKYVILGHFSFIWPFWVIKHIWYYYWLRSSWIIRHNHELKRPDGHLGFWHNFNEGQIYITLSSTESLIDMCLFEHKLTTNAQR
jgi:hypothetical protein